VDRPWREPDWNAWRVRGFVLGFALSVALVGFVDFLSMGYTSVRAEAPSIVSSLRGTQLAHDASFDRLVPLTTFPRPHAALDFSRHAVEPNEGLDTLRWQPDGELRGAYTVLVREDGSDFLVVGVLDTDDDDFPAVYFASRTTSAQALTPRHVY